MFPKLSILTQRAALRRGRCFLFSQFLKPLPVGRLQNEKRPFTEKQTALRFIFQLVFSSSLSIPKGWASLKAAPSESLNYEDREEVSPLWTRRVLYRKENSFSSSSSSLFSSGPWTYLSRSLRGETISSPRDFFFIYLEEKGKISKRPQTLFRSRRASSKVTTDQTTFFIHPSWPRTPDSRRVPKVKANQSLKRGECL